MSNFLANRIPKGIGPNCEEHIDCRGKGIGPNCEEHIDCRGQGIGPNCGEHTDCRGIRRMGGRSPFVIEANEVERQRQEAGLTIRQFLALLVKPTQLLARPPISKFYVGAVGLGASGRVFKGVNLEFEGLPLHHSVHAEQFLVANAALHGEHRLQFIAVSAAPCGHCRQFLQELRGAPEINVLIADQHAETQMLSYFLPHRFGPDVILQGNMPLLLEPRGNGLSLKAFRPPELDPALGSCNGDGDVRAYCGIDDVSCSEAVDRLRMAALQAANASHAPYSNCPSGVAVMTAKGRIYTGYYMESAAHNPGLPPLQGAIVGFVSRDGGDYEDIVRAVLVEKEGAIVQQADTVRLALKKISPKCSFHLFNCQVD